MAEDPVMPDACNVGVFVAARIAEIKSISNLLEDCDHGRRAFQTLPRHMQRRQVSSNPRRLPHYLHDQHKREGGNNAKVTRRPSRKHRRRPRNLLAEYNRRQKDHIWLETHIWHAKRFHMIRRWGYTVPNSSTFKGYRSSIRAAKTSCLVQDISYLCCIELEGNLSTLLTGLSRITRPSDFASLTRPMVKQGHQWEVLTIFKPDMQPYGALGDVDIVWLPSLLCSPVIAKLWIWVHPSAHSHVVEALVDVYDLAKVKKVSEVGSDSDVKGDVKREDVENIEKVQMDDALTENVTASDAKANGDSSSAVQEAGVDERKPNSVKKRKREGEDSNKFKKKRKDVNGMKLAIRNIPFERTPKYHCDSTGVSMTLLKDTLGRFRLTGPESISVLKAAFIPASVSVTESMGEDTLSKDEETDTTWWRDYYCNEGKVNCHQNQVDGWTKLCNKHLENRRVFPLTIRDPRVTLPRKKCPIKPAKAPTSVSCPTWPTDSPMYVSAMRDRIVLSKEPDAKVNARRSQLLIPGSQLPECPEESRLPILMLSRPSTHAVGYGMGLDMIVCSGWGMSVWLPIILNGGVASGQQAAENLYMEFLTPQTPNLFPDTPSADFYSTVIAQERRTEFFKRPPGCRKNFIKLGVQYPFHSPWRKLVQDWVVGAENVFSLRNPVLLRYLATQFGDAFDIVRRSKVKSEQKGTTASNGSSAESLDFEVSEDTANLKECTLATKTDTKKLSEMSSGDNVEEELQRSTHGCLVKVKLILEGKGSLESCAMICLPQKDDIEAKEKGENPCEKSGIVIEPVHIDTQQEHREKLKLQHTQIKRKIHNLKTKIKLKLDKEMSVAGVVQRGDSFKKIIEMALEHLQENNEGLFAKHTSYNSDMEDLWLMRRDETLQCCARKIMGYITHGDFSMTIGRGAGIGWVALKPLLDCLQMYRNLQSSANAISNNKDTSVNYVLVRNPSSLQYYWARLSIVK